MPDLSTKTNVTEPPHRDRNDQYLPTGLYLDGRPQHVEITPDRPNRRSADLYLIETAWGLIANAGGSDWSNQTLEWQQAAARWRDSYHDLLERAAKSQPAMARIAHGQADELNRDHGTWWWADVSGDGTHWSHFRGHRIQVDVAFHTYNERDVNHWKGRDEIRACGEWQLSLNRQPICDGYIRSDDPLATLRHIETTARQLIDHPAIDWLSSVPVAEQIAGRRVYYERTPAVVSYVSTLNQGCVGLKPVGVDQFPPSMFQVDRDDDIDPYERNELKVELLSPHVHWWRDKLVPGVETAVLVKEEGR